MNQHIKPGRRKKRRFISRGNVIAATSPSWDDKLGPFTGLIFSVSELKALLRAGLALSPHHRQGVVILYTRNTKRFNVRPFPFKLRNAFSKCTWSLCGDWTGLDINRYVIGCPGTELHSLRDEQEIVRGEITLTLLVEWSETTRVACLAGYSTSTVDIGMAPDDVPSERWSRAEISPIAATLVANVLPLVPRDETLVLAAVEELCSTRGTDTKEVPILN